MRNIYTVLLVLSTILVNNSFGQILWSDDFSDGEYTSNWEWTVLAGTAQIEQNNSNYELKLTGSNPDWSSQIYSSGDPNYWLTADDYTVTYTTRMHGPSTLGSALLFKADNSNNYIVLLSGTGIYILRTVEYVASIACGQIQTDKNINVKIQSKGDTVRVKVWASVTEPANWNLKYDSCYTTGSLNAYISPVVWWLNDTSSVYFDNFVVYGSTPVDVKETIPLLKNYSLSQNYPNPFNPSTSIRYSVPVKQFVSIKVYDVLGNETAVLVNEEKPAGVYKIDWRAANLPSGIYFYKLQADNFTQTQKMILLK